MCVFLTGFFQVVIHGNTETRATNLEAEPSVSAFILLSLFFHFLGFVLIICVCQLISSQKPVSRHITHGEINNK